MDLSNFNLWWKKQNIPPSLKGKKRKAFDLLLPYLMRRQGVILEGIRRAGKTMFQQALYLKKARKRALQGVFLLFTSTHWTL